MWFSLAVRSSTCVSWRNVTNSENRDGIDQTITDLLRKWSLIIEQSLSLQFCFYPCQKGGKGKVFKLFKKHWSFPSFQLWDHQKRPSVFLIFGKMWLFWYWFNEMEFHWDNTIYVKFFYMNTSNFQFYFCIQHISGQFLQPDLINMRANWVSN